MCVKKNDVGKVTSWIRFEGRESYRICGKINFGSKRKKKQECRLSNRKEGGAFAGSREGSGCRGNGQERLRFGNIR